MILEQRPETELELSFAQRGAQGARMARAVQIEGKWMVGHQGDEVSQLIELSRAVAIYKAGWKVPVE